MATWEAKAASKRNTLQQSIPLEWRIPKDLLPPPDLDNVMDWPETSGWFTKEELAITDLTAEHLVRKLAGGAYTSEAVTRAFCKRAAAAHQLTNCLSETCFDRAIATARALDEHYQRTGKPIGPLHGLPISLKDNFNLKGLDATLGFVSHIGDPAKDDSTLAKILQEAGAVFYVKTNVPTAMMIAETINNVFGRTTNPRNRRTTSGGSSGGEASLIAFKGSPLGVGSDIGGSLRIPAACTGIFTLRPSFGRFPTRDCRSGMAGQEGVNSVNGPMARSLEDVQLYSRVVIDSQPWVRDAKCVPIPWRDVTAPRKLKIGVIWSDGIVQPTPPVARALRETVNKLRADGFEVVDWDVSDMGTALALINRFFRADNGVNIRGELARGEEPYVKEMVIHEVSEEVSVADTWKLQAERSAFQNAHLLKWQETGVDALLLPNMPYVTQKHSSTNHIGYTGMFNVLDYSCVTFPTGLTVDKSVDVLPANFKPLNSNDEKIQSQCK
ncbi:hypothetical protein VHEMI05888 [[Torrubiella] hemipterigena]|uniref:amidase n=1 Tax=[Torrubiella] hemipterigena TaxID=1531966 RepID=A0A0A1SZ33_9HYPO|nr:hypothetical protein VHEMI05888 [[Torrubiella] hemipterigena]